MEEKDDKLKGIKRSMFNLATEWANKFSYIEDKIHEIKEYVRELRMINGLEKDDEDDE